jgi:hypothetical protein
MKQYDRNGIGPLRDEGDEMYVICYIIIGEHGSFEAAERVDAIFNSPPSDRRVSLTGG